MTGITLELTTDTIQLLAIAVITRKCEKNTDPAWEASYEDILQVLADLNKMCSKENNYTLTAEISA